MKPISGRVDVGKVIRKKAVQLVLNINREEVLNYYSNSKEILFAWRSYSEDTVLFRGKFTQATVFSGNFFSLMQYNVDCHQFNVMAFSLIYCLPNSKYD